MVIHEAKPDGTVVETLIRLSEDWAAEGSCYGTARTEKRI